MLFPMSYSKREKTSGQFGTQRDMMMMMMMMRTRGMEFVEVLGRAQES